MWASTERACHCYCTVCLALIEPAMPTSSGLCILLLLCRLSFSQRDDCVWGILPFQMTGLAVKCVTCSDSAGREGCV